MRRSEPSLSVEGNSQDPVEFAEEWKKIWISPKGWRKGCRQPLRQDRDVLSQGPKFSEHRRVPRKAGRTCRGAGGSKGVLRNAPFVPVRHEDIRDKHLIRITIPASNNKHIPWHLVSATVYHNTCNPAHKVLSDDDIGPTHWFPYAPSIQNTLQEPAARQTAWHQQLTSCALLLQHEPH